MLALDPRTVFTSYFIVSGLCLLVIWSLWSSSRSRIPGAGLWLVDYVLQWTALLLLLLRDIAPDFVSIVVANLVLILGTIFLYEGLARFAGVRVAQRHNWAFLGVFSAVQVYFTYVTPDLHARNMNGSVGIVFLTVQIAWLVLRRADPAIRKAGRMVGVVTTLMATLAVARIVATLHAPGGQNLFDSGLVDTAAVLGYQVLYIGLTFGLLMMVSRTLYGELEDDIKRRESAEEALRRSEARFSVAFHSIPDALLITVLPEGTILEVNEGFEQMTGWSAEEVAGISTVELEVWADPEVRDRVIQTLSRDGRVRELEAAFRRKSGEEFIGVISAETMKVQEQDCVLSIIHDVTARKRAEAEILRLNADLEERVRERTERLTERNRQLLEANARLDEATRAKSRFLASMSHELRTPLNSVIGFSGMLSQGLVGELAPEQKRQIEMINASGVHLLELVDEVLDLSAIESGETKVDLVPVPVEELLRSAAQSVVPMAQRRGLSVSVQVDPAVEVVVSDRMRLKQVLLNLLGNSIKFTDEGSVSVRAERDAEDLVITVADTGRGIPEAELERVFDDFYQVERTGDAKAAGAGLGLAVSRRLVEMLGGTLSVESELGAGSSFVVRLPCYR